MNAEKPQARKPGPPLESGIARLRGSEAAAWAGPFIVFMLLLPVPDFEGLFPPDSDLPWWRTSPEHWLYPLQCIVCLGLLWFWRRHYTFRPVRGLWLGAAMGVAGLAVWLLPFVWHAETGFGNGNALLQWFGFRERTDGFDPTLFDRQSNPVGSFLTLGFRLLRLVIVVPLIEEIFWRGFLMRWLIDSEKPWHQLPIGTFERKSFLITTLFFALAHWGPDFGVALVFGAMAGFVTVRTRSLAAVVLMHAVANLCLGLYILKTGAWGLW